ncbi:leucyl aminopeptidase [Luteimicrobium sp. NPDC057192]|uniref:leucyl aminopeptidase n=1 Tax=Luteimicrobium sp. NPDC057192 TaxID=3346042 RepID=UPI00362881D6
MTDLTVTSTSPASLDVDALVVGAVRTELGPRVLADALPAAAATRLASLAPALGITGAPDDVHRFPAPDGVAARVVVVTGLGSDPDDAEALRRGAGAAVRTLAGTASVAVALPVASDAAVSAVLEGSALGAYAFDRYTTDPEKPAAVGAVQVVVPDAKAARDAVERARVLATSVHLVRDLVNAAPNDLYPEAFAGAAKDAAKGTGVKVTVLDDKALASGGYGGLVAVGQGSVRGPRLVKVAWSPSKPAAKVALVGKGITFDSGGISLKPPTSMVAMKSDMAGAAAVLGTVLAAARLKLPVAVTGWLCLAENMPSGTAQRPSDVITIRGGKTVEVLNTDAEGRLVLADGLVAALEEGPDVVLDVATLTGAQMVALGARVSAVMGSDDVRDEVVAAAGRAGEQFWPMPLPAELRESLASKVADIANIGERHGGMLVAGLFLKDFVGQTPWAHLDIAGPAFNESSAFGYTPVGGTGVAVRTLLELVESRGNRG